MCKSCLKIPLGDKSGSEKTGAIKTGNSVTTMTFFKRTQRKGLCELRDICAEGKIKISVSDKGGEFAVISSELDRAITKLHFTDDSLYLHRHMNLADNIAA
ncbi:hypothetical protein RB195_018462 [Necator americanus]|uniref:Uncharacterized protein n=1 Tax=Necator americanus TaxID=51031 RepID=A0ABR1CCY8_NECAM